MQTLKDDNIVWEVAAGNNFEYILSDNAHFVNTDYKVLQSQTNGIFVPCMKMTRNGKTDLYYVIDDYRPLSAIAAGMTADALIAVAVNLLAGVIEVRNNGFLACQCIDLSWDKVYVEPSTFKVKLVYLPLSMKAYGSYAEFESELRAGLVKLINDEMPNMTDRLHQLMSDLGNGTLSLVDVYNKSRSAGAPSAVERSSRPSQRQESMDGETIKLVAVNAPGNFEIVIDSDDVLIGKKQELVDKVISFNKMISRRHCRITKRNGVYCIMDEGSANGTYVNQSRLSKGQQCPIRRGDIVRLADSDFRIE